MSDCVGREFDAELATLKKAEMMIDIILAIAPSPEEITNNPERRNNFLSLIYDLLCNADLPDEELFIPLRDASPEREQEIITLEAWAIRSVFFALHESGTDSADEAEELFTYAEDMRQTLNQATPTIFTGILEVVRQWQDSDSLETYERIDFAAFIYKNLKSLADPEWKDERDQAMRLLFDLLGDNVNFIDFLTNDIPQEDEVVSAMLSDWLDKNEADD